MAKFAPDQKSVDVGGVVIGGGFLSGRSRDARSRRNVPLGPGGRPRLTHVWTPRDCEGFRCIVDVIVVAVGFVVSDRTNRSATSETLPRTPFN